MANAEFLTNEEYLTSESYIKLIDYYKRAMKQMDGRAPGQTTINAVSQLKSNQKDGYKLPFNPRFFL